MIWLRVLLVIWLLQGVAIAVYATKIDTPALIWVALIFTCACGYGLWATA